MTVEAPGHPVLDSLISRYRASLGSSIRMDGHRRRVLHFWELTASQTSTEEEAIKHLDSLWSLAIDHYRDNRPPQVPAWNLMARYRAWRLLRGLEAHLAAAKVADRYHFYMVKTYPQVLAYHLDQRKERQS